MLNFRQIDASNRQDHTHLREEDDCIYLYEYTSGQNFSFSSTNDLINNLKKKPSLAGTAQYRYKGIAIERCAKEFRAALNENWVGMTTFVPVPGSKAVGHPDFDNRMEQVCRMIGAHVDVRSLVVQSQSTDAAHEVQPGAERITVRQLTDIYTIDESLTTPNPTFIAIVDDVLTAGTHFRAMKTVLERRFPDVPTVGIFVARRVFATPPEALEDDITF